MGKSISKNKKAYHDYFIEQKFEAGIVLIGAEVKSLRNGKGQIGDGYAFVRNGEAWLINVTIAKLPHASYMNHEERRDRKLLLSRRELRELDKSTRIKGYTLVPLELYFNESGLVKVELGLARGKASYDKRETAKKQDAKREMDQALKATKRSSPRE